MLYIGTDNGLLRATPASGSTYDLEPCGLAGKLVSSIVVDAGDPACLLVGTRNDGMHRSRDGGRTWSEINTGILYKEIWSLVQHPTTGELYAGSAPPAVFKSSNRGDSWTHCSSLHRMEESLHWTFPPPPHIAHVKDLKIVPQDESLVYGAIEEGWIIRSTDGGATWETLKQGVAFDSHAVTILPDDPRVVIATSGVGVFRSENGGDKFVRSDEGIQGGFFGGGYMSPAAVHPARPDVLFAGAAEVPPPFWFTRAQGAHAFFYRSDDRGKTWKKLAGKGLPDVMRAAIRSCVIHPSDPSTVFFGMTDGSVWLTEDDGASFRRIIEGLPGWIAGLTVTVPAASQTAYS
jgi:photosystem II stability/assembly factor-like uncharacterized protein